MLGRMANSVRVLIKEENPETEILSQLSELLIQFDEEEKDFFSDEEECLIEIKHVKFKVDNYKRAEEQIRDAIICLQSLNPASPYLPALQAEQLLLQLCIQYLNKGLILKFKDTREQNKEGVVSAEQLRATLDQIKYEEKHESAITKKAFARMRAQEEAEAKKLQEEKHRQHELKIEQQRQAAIERKKAAMIKKEEEKLKQKTQNKPSVPLKPEPLPTVTISGQLSERIFNDNYVEAEKPEGSANFLIEGKVRVVRNYESVRVEEKKPDVQQVVKPAPKKEQTASGGGFWGSWWSSPSKPAAAAPASAPSTLTEEEFFDVSPSAKGRGN